MLQVNWITCNRGGSWCPLDTVELANITTSGVYVIWHAGSPSRVVRIGQGDVAARISAHRKDSAITKFSKQGSLFVTWAAVPAAQQDGVERYLADRWSPLVGDAFPDVTPIAVNDPW